VKSISNAFLERSNSQLTDFKSDALLTAPHSPIVLFKACVP